MKPSIITISASIFSVIVSFSSMLIGFLLIKKHWQRDGKLDNCEDNHTTYFKATSEATVILNALCGISCTVYCVWVAVDPPLLDNSGNSSVFFIASRAASTIFWFASKVSIIYIYNGRLYYTFLRSIYKTGRPFFISVNIFITVAAAATVVCGVIGIHIANPIMISLSFEGFRALYVVLTVVLVGMFSKKLLLLHNSSYRTLTQVSLSEITGERGECHQDIDVYNEEEDETLFYLEIASKNAVLVSYICLSACFVGFLSCVHDYMLKEKNYLTLLIPTNGFAFDGLVVNTCIYLLFSFACQEYEKLCGKCDQLCNVLFFSVYKIRRNQEMEIETV